MTKVYLWLLVWHFPVPKKRDTIFFFTKDKWEKKIQNLLLFLANLLQLALVEG